ncbi:hypothetical protein NUW58_g6222 [Xylaria curta]|uniref:Uncharacterized protein n=1 Tax=Xylaria curta TaxID=42375 RepID=A0ACC1NWA7_9PEZI|nr:hypothetical protein NUW58_g6222 [Xylaria curta]
MAPALMTGNTDTKYYWDLTKHIFRYGPGYDPEQGFGLGGIHTVNEKISVAAHTAGVQWTLKHKTTFREVRRQLCQRSQKYKLDQNESLTLEHARKDDVPQPESSHLSRDLPPARAIAEIPLKKRRIAPTTILDETDMDARQNIPEEVVVAIGARIQEDTAQSAWSYLGPDAVTRLDFLNTTTIADEPQEFQGFFSDKRPSDRCLQMNSLLKRYFLGTHGADDDIALPLYGDSDEDEEYDSETWEEIQQEKRQKAAARSRPPGLGPEEVVAIIDEAIRGFISVWKQRKLPKLLSQASKLWHDARRCGLKKAIEQEHGEIQMYKPRLEKFRKEILSQRWSNEAEPRSTMPILEQTVLDMQSASWRLRTLRAPQGPTRHANPSRATATKAKAAPSHHVREDEDILTSEDDLPIHAGRRHPTHENQQTPHLSHQLPIVISDDEKPPSAGITSQVIDLTQGPDEPQNEHPSDVLVNLDKNVEREIWEFACAFSGHDPAKTDGPNPKHHHSFQGLGITIKLH